MAISEQRATSPYVGRRVSLDEFLQLPEQEPAFDLTVDGLFARMYPKRPERST